MSESKDRSGDTPGKTFDEAWESLPESPDNADGGTRAWTEEVRGARKHDADGKTEVEEAPPPKTDKTMAWTDEVRGALQKDVLKADAGPKKVADDAEDEMDRLMKAEPSAAPPKDDEEVAASASTSAMSFSALELPKKKPDASMMDALMGAPSDEPAEDAASEPDGAGESEEEPSDSAPEETAAAETEAPKDDDESSEAPAEDAADDSDDSDDEEADDDALPPPIPLHPERQAKSEPEPKPKAKPTEVEFTPQRKKSRTPLFVGGVVAAGLALWFSRTPKAPPPKDTRVLGAPSDPAQAKAVEPTPPTEPDVAALPKLDVPKAGEEPAPERTPPAVDPNRDPREPPEGTPPEIAAVFKKLPVSPADRAPVGGVGKTGIHIDDVSMGRGYERSRCTGGNGSFSVSKDDLANVCLRVVHQRQKEELSVVWQKVEGNARRGKIVVKSAHAYRTRAYLKLRSEYVGDWEVKIFSDDGVELARYPFSIVP
jgi:hypothetical protein